MNKFKKIVTALLINMVLCSILFVMLPNGKAQSSYIKEFAEKAFNDSDYSSDSTSAQNTMYDMIGEYIAIFLELLAVILVVVIIYAGFLWLTAGGNAEQVSKAQQWIINAVIGMVIVGMSYLIVGFIIDKAFRKQFY